MPPVFDTNTCIKCKKCVNICPGYVLTMSSEGPRVSFSEECWHCGCCRVACPVQAIGFEFPLHTRL